MENEKQYYLIIVYIAISELNISFLYIIHCFSNTKYYLYIIYTLYLYRRNTIDFFSFKFFYIER